MIIKCKLVQESRHIMFTFNTDNKKVTVYPALAEDKPVVYLTTYNDDGSEIYDVLKKLNCLDFTLVTISGLNWEAELSPWAAGNLFKYSEMFTGGVDEYLKTLTERIMPRQKRMCRGRFCGAAWRGIRWPVCLRCMRCTKRICSAVRRA